MSIEELVRFKTAVESIADAVIILDKDERVNYVNHAFEKMSGFTTGELLGKAVIFRPLFLQTLIKSLK